MNSEKKKQCGDKNRNNPGKERLKWHRGEVTATTERDQFFELCRAIRDLDRIEMGFVIDRYTFITSTIHTNTNSVYTFAMYVSIIRANDLYGLNV